uniref:DUF1120 domain-containing protein n=1 Tax=Hafnia alvei TaxID=569 RepID=UPI00242D2950|nr:DUF1120 domain-containing protein [Hafnia alvei]
MTGGATLDYGKILSSDIPQGDYKILDDRSLDFSIACQAPTKVARKSQDTQNGTNTNPVGKKLLGSAAITANTHLNGLGQADGKNIGA